MKNIKQTIIGVFAIIGVLAILTGSTNTTPQPTYATPESHVWEIAEFNNKGFVYMYNKQTGDVRVMISTSMKKYWEPQPVEK